MKRYFLILFILFLGNAIANCVDSAVVPNVPVFFYGNPLGTYTIYLTDTLHAATDGSWHRKTPYFEKIWTGSCPGGLSGGGDTCIELTVYPSDTRFSPAGIMEKIKSWNQGKPNRGEVRILVDQDRTQYVYTTDHEQTYCGPYSLK